MRNITSDGEVTESLTVFFVIVLFRAFQRIKLNENIDDHREGEKIMLIRAIDTLQN